MGSSEMIKINIEIAGKSYPVKVHENEEHIVREIENEISVRIGEFKEKYPYQSHADYLSMVLLKYAFDNKKNISTAENSDIETKLDEINVHLERLLTDYSS